MLNVNPETVCFLISRARQFHAKEEVVIPDIPNSPADDWGRQALADHINDTTYQEFRNTVNDLEPDQQQEVVALFWLGRGEFEASEWETAVNEARESWTPNTASYLLGHPLCADYLLEGLVMLDYRCEV